MVIKQDEEGQAIPVQSKNDPLTHILGILKSGFNENMKSTKKSFEILSNTHDEAKTLIDGMAENYRKLQVFQKWKCP